LWDGLGLLVERGEGGMLRNLNQNDKLERNGGGKKIMTGGRRRRNISYKHKINYDDEILLIQNLLMKTIITKKGEKKNKNVKLMKKKNKQTNEAKKLDSKTPRPIANTSTESSQTGLNPIIYTHYLHDNVHYSISPNSLKNNNFSLNFDIFRSTPVAPIYYLI